MLHTAATIPTMTFAGDAHYHYLTDDIIHGGMMHYGDGGIRVPTGPGPGCSTGRREDGKYQRYYEEKGDYYADSTRIRIGPTGFRWSAELHTKCRMNHKQLKELP